MADDLSFITLGTNGRDTILLQQIVNGIGVTFATTLVADRIFPIYETIMICIFDTVIRFLALFTDLATIWLNE
jgi:hypothetical protein